jgi:hypothetical protein
MILASNQRTQPTRWGSTIKTLAQKGTPRTPRRRVKEVVVNGVTFDFHPTKGYRIARA